MGKRELVALLCMSLWFLMTVLWLLLTMAQVCLQFVIVMFSGQTHLFLLVDVVNSTIIISPLSGKR